MNRTTDRWPQIQLLVVLATLAVLSVLASAQGAYDVVLRGGRVIDPESGLDAVRNVGVTGRTMAAIGADADIAVFDPAAVADKATYENAAQYSTGFRHVLVSGVFVVRDGKLQDGVAPGQAIRAVR